MRDDSNQSDVLDNIDLELLQLLQQDASLGQADLASAVGLSVAGVHKRIKRLQNLDILKGTVAHLNRVRLGLDLLCFIICTFKTTNNPDNIVTLHQATATLPEVLECYWITGTNDAILKVLVTDHQALREFLKRFAVAQDVVDRVQTSIVLEAMKETHELPLQTSNVLATKALVTPRAKEKTTSNLPKSRRVKKSR
jgi:DNA-binding Lrp family transcriptional regulator